MVRGFGATTPNGLNSELILVLDSVSVALGQDSTQCLSRYLLKMISSSP